MSRVALSLGWLALALPACGGVVETSHDPGENTSGQTTSAAGKSTGDAATDNPGADTDLGDCKLGPKENYASDAPCAWVADGNCYDTREMACNCACPRSHNSACVSGFEGGPHGHVSVICN